MTDFAKSILGLGFKRDASPEEHSNSPLPAPLQEHPKKFLPKNLAAHPTTAVLSQQLAYGTTTTSENQPSAHQRAQGSFAHDLHPSVLNTDPSSQRVASPAVQSIKEQSQADSNMETSPSPPDLSQPVIITTDEKGQLQQAQTSLQPKGKLKVTIVGAKDLLISEYSQPYVVLTYECSEFVNNLTPSKLPMLAPHQNRLSPGMPMKQPRDKRPALYQRQLSTQQFQLSQGLATQVWNHEAVFDVVGSNSELDISVYDAAKDDAFLGQVRIVPNTDTPSANKTQEPRWEPLRARVVGERVTGSLQIKWQYTRFDSKKLYGPDDFEVLRLLGKGTFGQVYQVKNKDNGRIYAMKILSKKLIVKKKEIAHTIGERNILVRTSAAASPFIVGLKFSFQTPTDLYLVTDYMSGGELFWHLQKEGRFNEDRAKFYIAELVLALEHLHDNDIVYRDLKPENILLDAKGHIALCDFGLSKANLNNDGTTNTFCGTTEYLAPEVLLDESGYTKMVDFWSLGVLIFEMCCGWSPFYADNTQQMYKNIAFGKVRFPKEVLSPEGRSFVKGLLNRNPRHRLGAIKDARELKEHPFFQDVDWNLLKAKDIPPPFKPHLSSETDTSNFDPEFTNESTSVLKKHMDMASTPLSPGIQANFQGFTYVDDSAMDDHFSKSHRYQAFKHSGSFIPGNSNLPPDDEVIDDQIDEEDEMEIDNDANMESEEFVHGRFDL